jgi:hypothetical protein
LLVLVLLVVLLSIGDEGLSLISSLLFLLISSLLELLQELGVSLLLLLHVLRHNSITNKIKIHPRNFEDHHTWALLLLLNIYNN